jgi:hypothetical protein
VPFLIEALKFAMTPRIIWLAVRFTTDSKHIKKPITVEAVMGFCFSGVMLTVAGRGIAVDHPHGNGLSVQPDGLIGCALA